MFKLQFMCLPAVGVKGVVIDGIISPEQNSNNYQ